VGKEKGERSIMSVGQTNKCNGAPHPQHHAISKRLGQLSALQRRDRSRSGFLQKESGWYRRECICPQGVGGLGKNVSKCYEEVDWKNKPENTKNQVIDHLSRPLTSWTRGREKETCRVGSENKASIKNSLLPSSWNCGKSSGFTGTIEPLG